MNYPQFRAYRNHKNYFCIFSETQWEEKQRVGTKILVTRKEAKVLPDRFFIQDILNNVNGNVITVTEEDYQNLK
jgi:hypothetical protein